MDFKIEIRFFFVVTVFTALEELTHTIGRVVVAGSHAQQHEADAGDKRHRCNRIGEQSGKGVHVKRP